MTTNTPPNDNEPQLPDDVSIGEKSPGTILREAREIANLSTKEISSRLNLREEVVVDIERDHHDESRSATFTKGYIKSYAKLLNLPEVTVLGSYIEEPIDESKAKLQSFSGRIKRETNDNRLMMFSYLVVLLLVGMLVVWWWQDQSSLHDFWDSVSVAEENASEEVGTMEVEVLAPASLTLITVDPVSPITDALELPEELPEATTDPIETHLDVLVVPSVELESQNETQPLIHAEVDTPAVVTELVAEVEVVSVVTDQEPLLSMTRLEIVFDENCWIQVTDNSGERLAIGEKAAGRTIQLDGIPPYQIVIGAPRSVRLSYAGQPIDLSRFGAKVARLQVPE